MAAGYRTQGGKYMSHRVAKFLHEVGLSGERSALLHVNERTARRGTSAHRTTKRRPHAPC
jgi:hypothetical protein